MYSYICMYTSIKLWRAILISLRYIYMRIHFHIHAYTYIYMYEFIYKCINQISCGMQVDLQMTQARRACQLDTYPLVISMHKYTYTCIYTCRYMYVYIYIYIICIYIYTYTCIYVYILIHM